MTRLTRPQVYRVVREMLSRQRFGPRELLQWLKASQLCRERVRGSHDMRRSSSLQDRMESPP